MGKRLEFSYRAIFDTVAPHYEQRIMRAFGPFAESLIAWAKPQPGDVVLDVGCGTGIVARLVAPLADSVVGIDFSAAMLVVARQIPPPTPPHTQGEEQRPGKPCFVRGDAHRLPFAAGSFDLALASFGLNATDPRRSLAETARSLKPGGRLCFQEWGALHEYDRVVAEVLSTYAVEDADAPPELVALRDFLEEDSQWSARLQTGDDYQEILAEVGFVEIDAQEVQPIRLRLPVEDFLDYKTAWTSRIYEFAAMSPAVRRACLGQLESRLYTYADEDGILTYDPLLFRVQAVRGAP